MPLIETLVDDFGDGVITDPPWAASGNGATETAGGLELPCVAAFSFAETGTQDYELTGSRIFTDMSQAPATGVVVTSQAFLALRTGAGDAGSLRIGKSGANIVGQYVNAGPTFVTVFSAAYSAVTHRWLRLTEAAGTITWWTSPDGETWTDQGTADVLADLDFGIDVLDAHFLCGQFGGTPEDLGQARFEGVNVDNQQVDVDAVTVPVVVGEVTIAADQFVTVDGVTIPVVAGDDVGVGIDQSISVDAVSIPVVVGTPTITFVLDPATPTPAQPQGVQPGQLEWRELRMGDATPYRVRSLRGLTDRPPVRAADQEWLDRHGQLPGEDHFGPRTITATIIATGTSVGDFRENYAALKAALAPVGPESALLVRSHVIADGGERLVRARVRHADTAERTPTYARVEAQWHATDPRIYDTAPVTRLVTADSDSDGVVFPIHAPLVFGTRGETGRMTVRNNGNIAAPVQWIITGPCAGPAILNTTTGQTLEFDIQLGNGQILVADSFQRTVLLDGNTNAYDSLVTSGWFHIPPGETGLHFVTDTGTAATLRATFRSAWIM